MVRHYVRKSNQQRWSESDMINAIQAVRNKQMSFKAASRRFNVPRTTLYRKTRKTGDAKTVADKSCGRFKPIFTPEQELDFAKRCNFLKKNYLKLTTNELGVLAYQYAVELGVEKKFTSNKEQAGQDWCRAYIRRHPELAFRTIVKPTLKNDLNQIKEEPIDTDIQHSFLEAIGDSTSEQSNNMCQSNSTDFQLSDVAFESMPNTNQNDCQSNGSGDIDIKPNILQLSDGTVEMITSLSPTIFQSLDSCNELNETDCSIFQSTHCTFEPKINTGIYRSTDTSVGPSASVWHKTVEEDCDISNLKISNKKTVTRQTCRFNLEESDFCNIWVVVLLICLMYIFNINKK